MLDLVIAVNLKAKTIEDKYKTLNEWLNDTPNYLEDSDYADHDTTGRQVDRQGFDSAGYYHSSCSVNIMTSEINKIN